MEKAGHFPVPCFTIFILCGVTPTIDKETYFFLKRRKMEKKQE
jgi:hypothetical protein